MATAVPSGTHVAPYTADGRTDTYGAQPAVGTDPAYAVGYSRAVLASNEGWAPGVDPDPTRTGDALRHDRRANLRNPFAWWRRLDADTAARHSVETVDGNGWTENKGAPRQAAPDPRSLHWPETRPTSSMAPRTYLFERPFDQDVSRRLSGDHMSLAVNRRNYEILTMAPVPRLRNTYRTEPTPWDSDIVDETPNVNAGHPSARLQVPNIPPTNRTYRLD
jgi:hypothetical protein